MSTAKVSVAIGEDELAWARQRARQQGKSLSAVLTESLAEQKRLAALREVVEWMGEGQAPVTAEELAGAERILGVGRSHGPIRRRPAKKKRAASPRG